MRISDILQRDAIIAELKSKDKKGVLEELAQSVSKVTGADSQEIVKVLLEREHLGSTGIGGGIAIPHGKMNAIRDVVVGFGLSRSGVEFDSLDNKPVHLFFLLVTPENSTGSHLRVLAQISKLLKQDHFKQSLLKAESIDDIVDVINEVDEDF